MDVQLNNAPPDNIKYLAPVIVEEMHKVSGGKRALVARQFSPTGRLLTPAEVEERDRDATLFVGFDKVGPIKTYGRSTAPRKKHSLARRIWNRIKLRCSEPKYT